LLDRFSEVIGGKHSRTFNLVRRFVKTDRIPYENYKDISIFHRRKPKRVKRAAGVPQGGVLSGMLANLYLHRFDKWVIEKLISGKKLRYIRYADDFIILSQEEFLLEGVYSNIDKKLRELGLLLNAEKTIPIVDTRKTGLNFVGFRFTLTAIHVRDKNIQR